eukprot:gnl/Spiro4/24334_TR12091_c0_g1_i1.p1 gnl/Spiro4/24334_TR12091_c0_g1~~gnl/Spiro4/24334_TR12091_c0_g1_i1.p1  ORF type:complete len:160 (-),score=71.48 gnl/Spiro4/24334_TR12091_c0_g1_i1:198-677(-)
MLRLASRLRRAAAVVALPAVRRGFSSFGPESLAAAAASRWRLNAAAPGASPAAAAVAAAAAAARPNLMRAFDTPAAAAAVAGVQDSALLALVPLPARLPLLVPAGSAATTAAVEDGDGAEHAPVLQCDSVKRKRVYKLKRHKRKKKRRQARMKALKQNS